MKYVVLNADNSVAYTFPQSSNDSKLYSSEFLDSCVLVENSVDVPTGYILDRDTKKFVVPPVIEQVPPVDITPPPEPEPDPVAILAETVANLMYQMDIEKLNGGITK